MTFPNPGPASQSTGNVAGGPYVAWSGTNTTAQIGPAGVLVPLGAGAGGGVALYDGANSITSGTAQFSNANGVSFGFNAQTITASVAGFTQTNQTVASGGIAGSGFTSATTAGTAIVATNNSAGLSVGVPAYITTYIAGAVATGISSIADSANTQTVGMLSFANSHGVTFGISTGALTATITASVNAGNVTGISGIADSANTQTVGTLSFANSNGISFGLSTGANTATLTASYSQYQFSNSNGLTFGSNGSTVTGSYTVPAVAGLISGLNVSGGAGTSNSAVSGITFNNSNGITFGVSTGASVVTVTGSIGTFAGGGSTFAGTNVSGSITLNTAGLNLALSAPAPGAQQAVSYYEQQPWRGPGHTFAAASNSIGNTTVMYMQPFIVPSPISFYRGMLLNSASLGISSIAVTVPVSTSLANSTGSARYSNTWTIALFSRVSTGTNVNSSNISFFASTTLSSSFGISFTNSTATNVSTGTATLSSIFSMGFIANIDSLGGITSSTTSAGSSTSFTATTNANSNFQTTLSATIQTNYINGVRPIDFPLASSLSAGEYWFGIQQASGSQSGGTVSGAQNLIMNTVVLYGVNSLNASMYHVGSSQGAAGNLTFPMQFHGSVSSAQTTTTIGSNLVTLNNGIQTWFNLMAASL